MKATLKVFGGSSHPALTRAICAALDIPVGKSRIVRFKNENMMVQVEENVRECDVFVVQTSTPPVSDGIIELLIMIDALKHASAGRVTAVLPYFPYARSDKKDRPRISIAARLMADLLQAADCDRVLTMDLHSPQIQGFFHVPVDQLVGAPILCDYLRTWDLANTVLVAGDAGEAKELGRFANRLNLPMAVVDKRRYGDDDKAVAANLIGEVRGKHAIIVDDEIATGGTIVEAANFLLETGGVLSTKVAATHAVFSGEAMSRIEMSNILDVVVTDTIPLRPILSDPHDPWFSHKIKVISVAELFAKAIRRIHDGDSVSDLF